MKLEYCPTEMVIEDFYTKPLQGELFRLFRNLILNLREENISDMTSSDKLTKMEIKIENADREKAVESAQECVMENEKSGSLNIVNHGVGSDYLRNAVDTCDIILRIKPELLIKLKSVATGAA